MIDLTTVPSTSPLIDDKLSGELKEVFKKLQSPIVIKALIDSNDDKSKEQAALLRHISTLSDMIDVELYDKDESSEVDELDDEYLPVTGLYKDGVYSGIAFHGVPGGQEINSLVLAIYNLSGPGQNIDKSDMKKIGKINTPINIKICVSLSCHHCPKTVTACQIIAAHSQYVEAEMIDANLYPSLVERYKIERVPLVIFDDTEVRVGPDNISDMINLIKSVQN